MKGLIFPLTLNDTGGVDWTTSTEELVKTNLKAILAWPYNNRFFFPEFGTRLSELLETEPNDDVLIAILPNLIGGPISMFEPRVKILQLEIESRTEDCVKVLLSYVITESNIPDSFTYPFYINPKN